MLSAYIAEARREKCAGWIFADLPSLRNVTSVGEATLSWCNYDPPIPQVERCSSAMGSVSGNQLSMLGCWNSEVRFTPTTCSHSSQHASGLLWKDIPAGPINIPPTSPKGFSRQPPKVVCRVPSLVSLFAATGRRILKQLPNSHAADVD